MPLYTTPVSTATSLSNIAQSHDWMFLTLPHQALIPATDKPSHHQFSKH